MSDNSEQNRAAIINFFPGLANDKDFTITSPIDFNYNCLSWAANKKDTIWWPHIPAPAGVSWPIDDFGTSLETLTKVYEKIGYKACDSWEFEKNLKKIALYIIGDKFSHAARQLRSGLWTSKLGPQFDITHGTPYTIEGEKYGKVATFMSIVY